MSVGLVQTFRAFAYNDAWANHRLLGACAGLAQGEFEAEGTGFFPSLQETLNHIYVVDLFYVDALELRIDALTHEETKRIESAERRRQHGRELLRSWDQYRRAG